MVDVLLSSGSRRPPVPTSGQARYMISDTGPPSLTEFGLLLKRTKIGNRADSQQGLLKSLSALYVPWLCLTCAFGFKRLFKGECRPRAKEAPRKNQTLRNSPLARFFCADCRSCDTASTSFTTWARERSPTLSPAPPVFNRHMPAVDLLLYRFFNTVPVSVRWVLSALHAVPPPKQRAADQRRWQQSLQALRREPNQLRWISVKKRKVPL